MKQPYFSKDVLDYSFQQEVAEAFGLKNIQHEYLELSREAILYKVNFKNGRAHFDPFTIKPGDTNETQHLYYHHPKEHLTLIEKGRELSLWERILPQPWGLLKGLHKKDRLLRFAAPDEFQKEWEIFFALLDELEVILSSSEISALHIHGIEGTASLLMRFLRKKCVGIAHDPISESLYRRKQNGGFSAADLYELWGTSATFFTLKLDSALTKPLTLTDINNQLKQALLSQDATIHYRIPTLEDGVIEMGL